jgi:hypothetical protein
MSRGPGRLQRLLLHAVYHDPISAPSGRLYVNITDYGSTDSEISALYRAARAITRNGWVKQCGGQLDPLPEPPTVVANCQLCEQVDPHVMSQVIAELLELAGVQVPQNATPEHETSVSVQNNDDRPCSEPSPAGVQVPGFCAPERETSVSVQKVPDPVRSEPLPSPANVQGCQIPSELQTPERQPAVKVRRDPAQWITGLDGKHYPRTTGGIRRDRQIVLLRSGGTPIRSIASEVGCSVGTVHRVLSQWQVAE